MSADLNNLRLLLQRLIHEAMIVAPSIAHAAADGDYRRVSDTDLDRQRLITFEIEAESALRALAVHPDPVFRRLLEKYDALGQEGKKFHSRSIWVHRTQMLLQAGRDLLGQRQSSAPPVPKVGDPPLEARFWPMLTLLWERSFIASEPVVMSELARECGLSEADALDAWRDFRDRRWIDTFKLQGAARIASEGRAAAAVIDAARGLQRPPDVAGSYLPLLTESLRVPLL